MILLPHLNYYHQPALQDLKSPLPGSQTVMPDLYQASCQLCGIEGSKSMVLHRWSWAGVMRIKTAKWCDAVSAYIACTIMWGWACDQVTQLQIWGAVVPGTCTILILLLVIWIWLSIPVAAQSKAYVFGRTPTVIVGSNPTGGMDVCLLWVLCVVR